TGGTIVTITGSGFTGASAVAFGGVPALGFTVNSDGQVTATSPPDVPGPEDVTVTVSHVTSTSNAGDVFTYHVFPRPQPSFHLLTLLAGNTTWKLGSDGRLLRTLNGRTATFDSGVNAIGLFGSNLLDLEDSGRLWLYNGAKWTLIDVGVADFG